MGELYEFNGFRLDLRERRLTRGDEPVHLEPKAFDLLHHLLRHAGSLVTKQDLIDSVWARAAVSDNALTRVVHQVRTGLGDHADAPEYLETVPGSGYRFIAAVTQVDRSGTESAERRTTRSRIFYSAAIAIFIVVLGSALLWIGRGATTTSRPAIERLAILPLANLTGRDGQQYLVQGVHESLIADLSRAQGLDVISRTSVMRYRQSDVDVSEIAKSLDVDAVVEGAVMHEGEELYVTVQLIAAAPEHPLWAERFALNANKVFETSAQIASSIAAQVGARLRPTQESLLSARRAVSPEAYNDFLQARFHFERKTPDDYREAQRLFRRAIDLDPQFASAYVGLAHTYGSAAVWGVQDPSIAMPEARSLAERAIALDGTLADARLILAGVSFYWDWNVAEAQTALRQVLEDNPNSAHAYRVLAEVLSVTGRHEEALAALERGRELDPLSPTAQFKPAFARYLSRDYEEAVETVRAGQKLYPKFWQGHWVLCLSLSALERQQEAIAACEAAVKYSGGASVALGALGYVFAEAGKTGEAQRIVAKLDRLRETRYVGAANLAIIYGALGKLDPAFEELERAYENRDWLLVHINNEGFFDPLRTDARFRLLQAKTPPPG